MALSREFREFLETYLGDKRGIPYPVANMSAQTFQLDNAQTLQRFDFSGDFIYADRSGQGVVEVRFNNPSMPPFPFAQNTAIKGFPFREVYLTWDAQPGEELTLWYGYGAEIIPPNQDITQILSTVSVEDVGMQPGSYFISNATMTVGTPLNAVAAASNTGGIRIHYANVGALNITSMAKATLLAKATAPATVVDGNPICQQQSCVVGAGAFETYGFLHKTTRIASGLRLDFMVGTTDASGSGHKTIAYDML